MQPRTRTATRLGLALLILCAFALRLYELDAQSLWYDEGVTAEVARRGIAELTRWTADDIQPPLYYYLIAGWGRLAGWSEWSLRFPSAFFGTLLVPLLSAVTIALTRRRAAGLLAAALGAFHPLLLYYSQEARMYAMLTALGVLLAYLVIHGESAIRRRTLHWTAYVLVAAAAIYTHYFAFFLLMALTIAYLVDQCFLLPRLRPEEGTPKENGEAHIIETDADLPTTASRRPIFGFVIANLIVLLLYLPWIMALFTRLAVDASYWDGEFKLVEAVRHVAISFTSGETVLEQEATRLLWLYGLLTLISLMAILLRRSVQPRTIVYALLWLALPVVAVLLLASVTPKFNPRYVMIALPGLLLLWSAGLTALVRLRAWDVTGVLGTPFVRLPALVALLVVLALHIGFFYSIRNWFVNPAFTKAEWRELSRYVRSRIQANPSDNQNGGSQDADSQDADSQDADNPAADDLIVLVSGHAWPVWNYYAPDLPPLRLPNLETLDVNAVLDFASTTQPLREALVNRPNVWLVQWQHEVVDPMSVVPLQLQLAGREEEVDAEFWQVRLRHYSDVQADRINAGPTATTDASINFGNQVILVDYQVAATGDLLLFWQLHPERSSPISDLNITGQTFTGDQPFQRIEDRRPVGYEYPTFRWRPGQINVGRIPAAEWVGAGALPGRYRVRLGVYDNQGDLTGLDVIGEQGQPLGKYILFDLDLPVATRGPDLMDPVTFAQIIPDLFLELVVSAEQAEPGQAFPMELHWYAEERPPDDYDLLLRWRLRDSGESLGEQTIRLTPQLPTSLWPDDERLRQIVPVRPPLNLPPDDYWLEVGITASDSNFVRLPFRVLGSSRIFAAPPTNTPLDVTFGESLHLLGVIEPLQINPRAGEQVALTLVWQALARVPADYTATLQWLGEDAKPAAQVDLQLPGGSSNWLAGQVELQTMIVTAPSVPGTYQLVTAVYNGNELDLPRISTSDGRDLVELGTVTVQP